MASPEDFLEALEEPRRTDLAVLHERIRRTAPAMRSYVDGNFLAYGRYEYRYASGRKGDWFCLGLASNKAYISLYAPTLDLGPYVARLPKANLGRGCIRCKRAADLDPEALDDVIRASAANDGRRIAP